MPKTPEQVVPDLNSTLGAAMTALVEAAEIMGVLGEVATEIRSARAKHGPQNHLPLGFGEPQGSLLYDLDEIANVEVISYLQDLSNADLERYAKYLCDDGNPTWAKITFEEFAEALAAADIDEARAELVQVAAMAVGSIIALDSQRTTS